MTSKALQIIVPSGNPNGLKRINAPGWSGTAYIVPRQNVRELEHEEGNNLPGLYILFGQDETTGEKLAYIGESENFYKRLTGHTKGTKDFWDTAVAFTGGLNKAYVKYLEHLATKLARDAGRMNMDNVVQPPENSLSDFDQVAVSQYFEQMQFILSGLSYEIFDPIEESIADNALYFLKGKGFDARAKLLDNGNMLVLAGSIASVKQSGSFGGWAEAARTAFVEQGILRKASDDTYEFTTDQIFKKPSPAAAVIAARSINGWTAWKDASGNTLDQNART